MVGCNAPWEKAPNSNVPRVHFSTVYPQATVAYRVEFVRHLTDSACSLTKEQTVYLVQPIPKMGVTVPKLSRRMIWERSAGEASISLAEYYRRHDYVWAVARLPARGRPLPGPPPVRLQDVYFLMRSRSDTRRV